MVVVNAAAIAARHKSAGSVSVVHQTENLETVMPTTGILKEDDLGRQTMRCTCAKETHCDDSSGTAFFSTTMIHSVL